MKKIYTVLLITLACADAFAITFYAEISRDENAPTVELLIQEASTSPPLPVQALQAFNNVAPSDVNYLIFNRATGNLKNLMENSPNWSQSKLHQMLVVTYTDNLDVSIIQSSLDNDPYIISASEITNNRAPKPSVPMGHSKKKGNQYITPNTINKLVLQLISPV